jgi:hypothetical protein
MSRAPESVFFKLARAQSHLKSLNRELAKFGEKNPYQVHAKASPDRRQVEVRLAQTLQAPILLAMILGDCIHNLRCALDHLIYALPRAPGADPRWEDWSQFPICDDSGRFASKHGRDLCGVDPAAIRAIEDMQPYYGGNLVEGHPLWYLRELSNLDKHRLAHLAWYEPANAKIEMQKPVTGTAYIVFATGSLQHGDTVAKIYFSDPAPRGFDIQISITFGITIRDITPAIGINAVLERIYERVVHTVCTLEPFLP